MTRTLQIRLGQFSDRGVKPANEDFHGALIPEGETLTPKGAAFAIADGMSSSELARLASEYAVKNFLNDYFATPDSWTVRHSAERVLSALNRWLCGQGASLRDPSRGMVTTFSALVLKSTTAHVFHVGAVWLLSQELRTGVRRCSTERRCRYGWFLRLFRLLCFAVSA